LIYHKGRNARYFFPLIIKATIVKGYHQKLFREKEKERINKSSEIKGGLDKLL